MKINQKGFSAVEGLLVVIIVGLIAGLGVVVYRDHHKKVATMPASTATTPSPASPTTTVQPATTKLSTVLTTLDKKVSIAIPDGWKMTNDTTSDYAHAIGLENMTYAPGIPATVTNAVGFRGGDLQDARFTLQVGTSGSLSGYFSASEYKGTITTTSGLEGKKYLFTSTGKEAPTAVKGTLNYGYQFTSGSNSVVISYAQHPTDPDQLKYVEDSIKSLKFL